jgi:hypothetical protein
MPMGWRGVDEKVRSSNPHHENKTRTICVRVEKGQIPELQTRHLRVTVRCDLGWRRK